MGAKLYELTDHLGNVRAVIGDVKLAEGGSFKVDLKSYTNYYPYGMEQPQRAWRQGEDYRYGYNGVEEDDELKGEGNSLSTYYRLYDPRLALWLGIDPVFHESQSPYSAMDGNPILYTDANGDNSSTSTTEYTVKSGDNMSTIAKAHGVEASILMAENPDIAKRTNATIYPGDKVKIPGKSSNQTTVGNTNPTSRTMAAQSQGGTSSSGGGATQSSGISRANSACGPNGSCVGNRGNQSAKEPSKAEQMGLPEINSWSDAGRALVNLFASPVKSIAIVAGIQKPSSKEEKVRAWVDFGIMAFTAGEAGMASNKVAGGSSPSRGSTTQAKAPTTTTPTTTTTAPKKTSVSSTPQTTVKSVERYSPNPVKPEDALDKINEFLGPGPHTNLHPRTGLVDPDRIVSADGKRSVRYGSHEMNSSPTKHHYHEEVWEIDPGNNSVSVQNTVIRVPLKKKK